MSYRSAAPTLFVAMTLSLLALSSCSQDRFNDTGCASDLDCREGRICDQYQCVSLDEANRPTDEEQAPDAGDVEDGEVWESTPDTGGVDRHEEAVAQFLGTWNTQVRGTMTSQNSGSSSPPIPSRLDIDISRGDENDLLVEIDYSLICPLEAGVRPGPIFRLVTEECGDDGQGMMLYFSNIEGSAQLDSQGELVFDFTANAAFSANAGEVYEVELTFRGPRAD